MALATSIEGWRRQPQLVMGALGFVSGVASGVIGFDFGPEWIKPAASALFIEHSMVPIGLLFAVAVALGMWLVTGKAWAIPVVVVATLYAWSGAIHTAIRLQTNEGGGVRLLLAGMAAGLVGALITHLGCAIIARELRDWRRIALTAGVGALAATLYYVTEREILPVPVLFLVWQPAVAVAIGRALARPVV